MLQGSAERFHAATGWVPEIPLEKTFEDLLDYWRPGSLSLAGGRPRPDLNAEGVAVWSPASHAQVFQTLHQRDPGAHPSRSWPGDVGRRRRSSGRSMDDAGPAAGHLLRLQAPGW